MGWLWSSLSSQTPEAVANGSNHATHQKSEPRGAAEDSDFEALVASLEKPTLAVTPTPKETPVHYAPSPSGSTAEDKVDAPIDVSPEALYPQTMSCRQAFDQAFYCQSLGGKFNDIYRYGELRSCSDNWSAFWFCMRIKNLPEHERRDRVRDYYREREEKIKAERGTSEDIWEIRTEPVKKAFWRNPDEIVEKP